MCFFHRSSVSGGRQVIYQAYLTHIIDDRGISVIKRTNLSSDKIKYEMNMLNAGKAD